MKWMIIVAIIALMGCALFKKTTKLSAVNEKESSKVSYLDKVDVQTANKETHTYTWWNDSSVYQYQNVQELVEGTKLEKVSSTEKELERDETVKKESTPVKIWIYAGIAILIIGLLFIIRKIIFPTS